ncbi:RNA polymerase sigma factor SigJ [Nesterenkonia ebinurensis]|uniref:RNA polymerase sigma factor SigJ n=1 Tax=Nesterenkonia ebinurensis TaxID=2608252 RepID=UPI00123C7ED1|nr:RNA polymerase sigma factor SigJ [Nesterenkonia ebinurensis]
MSPLSADEVLQAERPRLLGLGYRMLGTVSEAEDMVQEAFLRWYRLDLEERNAVENPGAWLMRAGGRISLDMLKSARRRREHYVGEWLPEPVPASWPARGGGFSAAEDPAERAELGESVSIAMMVLLETMTSAERAVFVLRETFALPFAEIAEVLGRSAGACRQLASAARRRLKDRGEPQTGAPEHQKLVQAFFTACETGNLQELITILDPEVVLRSDGGGRVSAARRPVLGRDSVARFVLGLRSSYPEAQLVPVELHGGRGIHVVMEEATGGLISFAVEQSRVTDVWIMRNPDKLTLWE